MKDKPASLVILLHGRGGSGAGLLRVAATWGDQLPGARIVAPDGPLHAEQGKGYQWFSAVGVSDGNRGQRVMSARPLFDRDIKEIVTAHGFADRLDRVILFGFSQGAILSLDALTSGRWPVAGVVGFAGKLVPTTPMQPSLATRVRLVQGRPTRSFARTKASRRRKP